MFRTLIDCLFFMSAEYTPASPPPRRESDVLFFRHEAGPRLVYDCTEGKGCPGGFATIVRHALDAPSRNETRIKKIAQRPHH